MNPHAKPSNSSAERKRQSIEQVRGGVGAALPIGHAVNQGESVGQIEILLGMEFFSLALYEHGSVERVGTAARIPGYHHVAGHISSGGDGQSLWKFAGLGHSNDKVWVEL